MIHGTNIVWGKREGLFLHEKALRAYFCAGVHIILARIVGDKTKFDVKAFRRELVEQSRFSDEGRSNYVLSPRYGVDLYYIYRLSSATHTGHGLMFILETSYGVRSHIVNSKIVTSRTCLSLI